MDKSKVSHFLLAHLVYTADKSALQCYKAVATWRNVDKTKAAQ